MAKRYFSKLIFGYRSQTGKPTDINEFIIESLKLLPSGLLQESNISKSFPKEAVFQHLLMNAFAKCTPVECSIYPEFSEIFPEDYEEAYLIEKIDGAIDFYINGDIRWGIEILVQGDRIGKHLDRFSENGRYKSLKVKDYAVIDFRFGDVTKINLYPKKITVFFHDKNYSSFKCIIGENPQPKIFNIN